MNAMIVIKKSFAIASTFLLFIGVQDAFSSNTSNNLTGSALRLEDGATKSQAIFIGTVTEVGIPSSAGPTQASYRMNFQSTQILLGSIDTQNPTIFFTDGSNQENPPEVGNSYIIFLKKNPHRNLVLKLLPATQDTIAKVKALIATVK